MLSGPDLESQRKQIYNEIAQRVHSNPDLENFRDILPKNGNFDILEYIGIPYDVMFYLQQTFQKSPEQISDLATAAVHTLLEIIHAQEEALKEALTKKLKQAEIVRHDTPDNFTDMLLGKNDGDIDQWNSLGYTQIERNKTTNKNFSKNSRDTSIKKGHWSMKSTDKKTPENLLEMSNFTVKGDPDEVMMFHGSREQFMKSLRNAIDWRKGGGYLGNGFYLTFNPNEAKMYACSTVLWGSSGRDDAVILETTIKNAKTLKRRGDKSWYSGSGDFRRNYRTDGGKLGLGWHDQINGRDKLLQNLEIKRIHLVPIKNLIVHGDGSNPGRNGRYTVRDKRGWICGNSNKRPPAKKKSRKARAKKKTVARVKPGSYLASLLDVLRSKNGWVVYEPAPSPMAIGPSIYVVKALKRGITLGLIEKLQTPGEKRLYMGHSYRLAGVTTPPKKSSKKKSRKAQKTRKKKTVAEWRAECKKQGLVYDTRTKRCRKSKKKSRKMKYKMRMLGKKCKMLKFRMKRGRDRPMYFVNIGQAPKMGRGGYTKDDAKDICKELNADNYVLVTTDVNVGENAPTKDRGRISHSVLLVKGKKLLESKRLTELARKEIKPTDLVVIDSNAGDFFQSLGGENIVSLKKVNNALELGNHNNYVDMVKDIQKCQPGNVKVFGHNFMETEYNEIYDAVKDAKDGVCGVFTEAAARWFQDPSYDPFRCDIGSREPKRLRRFDDFDL